MTQREPPALRSALWDVLQSLETLVHGLREGQRSLFVDVHAIRLQKETERRLTANPKDPDALFLRSAFLAKQGRFEDAVAIIDKLMKDNGSYPGAAEFRKQLKEMMKLSAPRTTRPRK
jgi:pentatricopeptide repeat protein